ncbi:ATP-binding protein [Mucilaginibacter sp. RS28]|uniref:histidine kinase n=1 Tax=Mucilaginibacter straminoryzae TaxID=2932774 RepID=A0A9X1X6G6_9SPHI|nr:ATP-binding protein [Mucilaginibacter straminoryzae]MCJ8211972.1 ATP-binding protein [Mucilaginibacter straminoryzae]
MKIKTRLRAGFAFLFIVFIFFGATALWYIQRISADSKLILKNNYETLTYTRGMRVILDQSPLPLNSQSFAAFNGQLTRQEHNVTEPGERIATADLRHRFEQIASNQQQDSLQQVARLMRVDLQKIEEINLAAILKKNQAARASASQALTALGFIGGFVFLILLSFSVNFPDFIDQPLQSLLTGIREITEKNYSQRLDFERDDEFGQVAKAFNRMALQLSEWEGSNTAQLKSEKLRIETIIEQMQDAIIGLDEAGKILFINKAAEQLLGIHKQAVTGIPITGLEQRHEMFGFITGNRIPAGPVEVAAGGKKKYYKIETREIAVPNYKAIQEGELHKATLTAGRVIVFKNVTEFVERDDAKTNFIATVSHELKTPISSIKMSLSLLQDKRIGTWNQEQEELLQQIHADNDRLLKLTGELLNMAQAETGKLQLNFARETPAKIVDYAFNLVRFAAEQKGVRLELDAASNLPMVWADVEKTAWVMVNLLSNALRYSPEDSVIKVTVIHQANNVVFSVQDFGKGIEEQYQQHLFDRYFQVPQDGQNKAGTGLGLAISKDFIEAQSGTIKVESKPGEGSKFTFTLPVVQ